MSALKAILKDDVLDLNLVLSRLHRFSRRPKLLQSMFKKVCAVWSQDSEDRMVLALLIIVKSLQRNPDFFSSCTRSMYLIYVKNSKFIYGNSIAKNDLMKMGLLEVYSLQLDEAYKHAFVFIRQLAITVRKAFLHADKEEIRSVYNWQFICSLKFWCEFVAYNAASSDLIKSLTHPLTQVILGAVSPGNRWIPLRFHLVECLHLVAGVDKRLYNQEDNSSSEKGKSSATLLVPSLPLLLDVFQLFDFNKRASVASRAPMDLRLMLHFSPSQLKETACMDAVADWLHDLLTEALCLYANSIAFPEYSAAALSEVRGFLKSCRVANFTRNFKSLLTKAKEHVDFVKRKRSTIKSLLDSREITALESVLGQPESPLLAYYLMHHKIRVRELATLSERFKFEGEEHVKVGDDFAQEMEGSTKAKSLKASERRSLAFNEEDSDHSDTASDVSYDIDDGTAVTHIPRSGRRSKNLEGKEEKSSDSGEADFDLDAVLNEVDANDDDGIANGNEDELKEFRIDDFEENDDDSDGKDSRRQRIMRDDPDLGAMHEEESEVETENEAEPMDVDMDSFSSGDEEELEEGKEYEFSPPKVLRLNATDKKFAPGVRCGKINKKQNSSERGHSLIGEKKVNNWRDGKDKKKGKRLRSGPR
ncbi:Nucleolar complex protein 2 -like protein [Echinococcus granulosus]|nr:Nucleolar complex protein 2 -like protein [Echinococcus granulosus]